MCELQTRHTFNFLTACLRCKSKKSLWQSGSVSKWRISRNFELQKTPYVNIKVIVKSQKRKSNLGIIPFDLCVFVTLEFFSIISLIYKESFSTQSPYCWILEPTLFIAGASESNVHWSSSLCLSWFILALELFKDYYSAFMQYKTNCGFSVGIRTDYVQSGKPREIISKSP